MATETEIAWFAGIFEGEGSIEINQYKGTVRLCVKMTDLDIIERVNELFPCNQITQRTRERVPLGGIKIPKTAYTWRIGKREQVKPILEMIYPYLGERRKEKADEAFTRYGIPSKCGRWGKRPPKTHCRKGHEYTPENTYIQPNGEQICKTCRKATMQRYLAKKSLQS